MNNQNILDLTMSVLYTASNQNLHHADINTRVREIEFSITATEIIEAVEYLMYKKYVRVEESFAEDERHHHIRYHLTFLGRIFYDAPRNESAIKFVGKPFEYESYKARVGIDKERRTAKLAQMSTWAVVILTGLQVWAAFWDKISPSGQNLQNNQLEKRVDSLEKQQLEQRIRNRSFSFTECR